MSDEKKVLLCEAGLKEGDTAWVQVVVGRDGELFFPIHRLWDRYPRSSGQRAAHLSTPVRDIVRAPVPREVVNVPCEVLLRSEIPKIGDIVEFTDMKPEVITKDWEIPIEKEFFWSNLARVLRPIKKP